MIEEWLKRRDHDVNCSRGGNYRSKKGTALHWAAYHGQLDIAKLLIEYNASMLLSGLAKSVSFCDVIYYSCGQGTMQIATYSCVRLCNILIHNSFTMESTLKIFVMVPIVTFL